MAASARRARRTAAADASRAGSTACCGSSRRSTRVAGSSPMRRFASSIASPSPPSLSTSRIGAGLRAGPHVPAADRVDRVVRHAAPVGDRADEPAVHVAQLVEQIGALFVGVAAEPALRVGVRAVLVDVDVDAELVHEPRQIGLAREDADRAGDRHRLGEDHVAAGRDEVAARRGEFDIEHRIGLTLRVANTSRAISSDASALPPGESMRRITAPMLGSLRAATSAADQRLAAGDATGRPPGSPSSRRRRCRRRCRSRRSPAAASGRADVSAVVDDADVADVVRDQLGDLVRHRDGVDELGVVRELAGRVRAAIDERLDLVARQVAAVGDRGEPLLVDRVEQRRRASSRRSASARAR